MFIFTNLIVRNTIRLKFYILPNLMRCFLNVWAKFSSSSRSIFSSLVIARAALFKVWNQCVGKILKLYKELVSLKIDFL